jgi:hypothetical protein
MNHLAFVNKLEKCQCQPSIVNGFCRLTKSILYRKIYIKEATDGGKGEEAEDSEQGFS